MTPNKSFRIRSIQSSNIANRPLWDEESEVMKYQDFRSLELEAWSRGTNYKIQWNRNSVQSDKLFYIFLNPIFIITLKSYGFRLEPRTRIGEWGWVIGMAAAG